MQAPRVSGSAQRRSWRAAAMRSSGMDTITSPQQVPGYGGVSPDESAVNPYLGEAGDGTARASDEAVQPSFSRKPTQGNDNSSIPLGLRDLVKDYFSSLDQK